MQYFWSIFRVRFAGARKWRYLKRNGKGIFFRHGKLPVYFRFKRGRVVFHKKYSIIGRRFLRKRFLRLKIRRTRRKLRRIRRRRIRSRRRRIIRRRRRIKRRRRRIRRYRRRVRKNRRRRRRKPRRVRGRRVIRRTLLRYHVRYVVYYHVVHHYYYSRISRRKKVYFKIHGNKIKKRIRRHLWRRISRRAFV